MTTCTVCGLPLAIGEYPCVFRPRLHARPSMTGMKQIGDEIDEINENVGHEPVHFRSRQEKKRYLKEHGLVEFVRNAGPNDKHVPRWVSVDLEAAKALVERM